MKHLFLIILILVLLVPSVALAQDEEPEPAAARVEVADETPIPAPNYTELILWFAAVIGVWAAWSAGVSRVVIDKGVKPVVNMLLSRFSGNDEIQSGIRWFIIVAGVMVGSFFAVQEFGYNIFEAAPDYVVAMVPNSDAQIFINAAWLAFGVFLFHDFKNWFVERRETPA